MRLVQVHDPASGLRVGLVREDGIVDLTSIDPKVAASTRALIEASERGSLGQVVQDLAREAASVAWSYEDLDGPERDGARLVAPIDAPEIWGAGVTYLRSRSAREAESTGFASFYGKVYEAERPELFIKTSNMLRVAGPHEPIGIRRDSSWTVPEPELSVAVGPHGNAVAYTIGNDVTARDIEAENPLYLPQAKAFRSACSLGPALLVAEDGMDPREWTIEVTITRAGKVCFSDSVSVSKMRRDIDNLLGYLRLDNVILPGTVLMTGTGIVPPDDVALQDGDVVEITIESIGVLRNPARLLG